MRSHGSALQRLVAGLLLGFVVAVATPAAATWSLVAVDPDTGEVGAAIASCVPAQALGPLDQPLFPLAVIPGRGVAVVQGQVSTDAPIQIRNLILDEGLAAAPTLAFVTSEDFDEQADARQYAIVLFASEDGATTLDVDIAADTGESTQPVSLDAQGDAVSVQGNILVSEAVVSDALAAFEAADGDLTQRLTAGLLAGSEAGGDSRCDAEQSALFAQLTVAGIDEAIDGGIDPATGLPDLDEVLTVVADPGGDNPVTILAERVAVGERSGVILPEASGRGALVSIVVALAAVAFVISGVIFWRAAYRRPMPAR